VSDADRREIEGRMRDAVLESSAFPEIRYRADRLSDERLAAGRYRLRIGGPLLLHGASQSHQVDVELTVYDDALQIRGESVVRLSDFHIKPVRALAGAIKLKDEVRLTFDLTASKQET
jgi:polyisoprenoid-binding protein YceI